MRRKVVLVGSLLMIVCFAAVNAKRCLPGCGPTGERGKARDQCKPCKRGSYTSPTTNCCIQCKGKLNITGAKAICTPKQKDDSMKHSNSTQCSTGFVTLPDPAACKKTTCWCPGGSFLKPKTTPARRMLFNKVQALLFAEIPIMLHNSHRRLLLMKRGDDDGPDNNRPADDIIEGDSNRNGTIGGNNATTDCTMGSKVGDMHRGQGVDDPLVPGDDVGKRWQCVPCPSAGQNPAPNTWRGCCTPPAVWTASGCA